MIETTHNIIVFLVLFMGWCLGVMTGQGLPKKLGALMIRRSTPLQRSEKTAEAED